MIRKKDVPQSAQPNSATNDSSHPLDHVVEIGLDKMKLCVRAEELDPARVALLEQRFSELKGRGAHARSAKGKAFKNRLSVRVGGEFLLIECSPNRNDYPYVFTVELNPNPFLREGERAIVNLVRFFRFLFGHDAPRTLSQAVATMLHVNVDFNINVLEGTLVSAKGKRGGANVMCNFDGSGTLGTLYVGVLGSDRRLCVYDKAAETLKRELAPYAGKVLAALASPKDWSIEIGKLREKLSGSPRWRMEVRCQPKGGRPVSELAEFASCFDGIRLLHVPADIAPFNTSLGRAFIGQARHDGIPAALQSLGDLDRRRINRAIENLDDVEWWNADILRDCIGTVIDKLAPLFRTPDRFHLHGVGQLVTMRPLPVPNTTDIAAPHPKVKARHRSG
ncbi:hypothetical protein DF024_33860 [Burkholderia cenocepacia]|nr:hypothetical protein DF024_33860 [Burkholderia cenocepacia]